MCTLTAAVFTRNDSTGSLSRRLGTPNVLFAQRLLAGPVPLRQSGSALDLVIAHADAFTLREATRQSGASISAAFDGCGSTWPNMHRATGASGDLSVYSQVLRLDGSRELHFLW